MTNKSTPPVASARPRRTPLTTRNRLSVKNKEAGYVYRVVNDVDDRIGTLQEQGYEIVPAEKSGMIGDKRVDNITAPGSSSYLSVGQGTKAVLMRIREDWFKEDQAFKQKMVDDTEQTMKRSGSDYGQIKISDRLPQE
jgi:hypothetical protein